MRAFRRFRPWREPPILFQILTLLFGGLVVAQCVTLFLTLVLPPAPPVQRGLDEIVAALRGRMAQGDRLARTVRSGPPDVSGPGWFVSDPSRHSLAAMLGADDADVRLAFYAPLPFAGTTIAPAPMTTALPVQRVSWQAAAEPLRTNLLVEPQRARLILADLTIAQAGPPPGGGGAGGGFPGGQSGFPGGGQRGDGFPRGGMRGNGQRGGQQPGGGDMLRQDQQRGGERPAPGDLARQPIAPGAMDEDRSEGGRGMPEALPLGRVPTEGFDPNRFQVAPQPVPDPQPAPVAPDPAPVERTPAPVVRDVAPAPAPSLVPAPAPTIAPAQAAPAPAPTLHEEHAVPLAPPSRALFGLAPAPYVEGDFVAAWRLPDGRWAVVQPAPEAFPNAWQRRVILWFLIAFAIVAPVGWLFARHIVRPLARFTDAAEQLGRDPSAALVALKGPAEIGRAANAFNIMQNRLRSFVDDRTAMVGAISHDLRTPLTRMRFRIEEVEEDGVRDGMSGEVDEMEAMIGSVLAFIRDASTPGLRERLDLGLLVDDVAEDATMIGSEVTVEHRTPAPVEVDVLGMRRLIANLVENAVKYGERAHIRLRVDEQVAIAEIRDDGPGVPEDEMERAFEPFYRASNAIDSGKSGSGLGLAVCRSIARAHGGDVRLVRSSEGFAAELRLPLAYDATRAAA